jgi:predicted DNA-binding protein with PD1-like motif
VPSKAAPRKKASTLLTRIPPNADLLQALEELCARTRITWGALWGIGAVKKACIGHHDQKERAYRKIRLNSELGIQHDT